MVVVWVVFVLYLVFLAKLLLLSRTPGSVRSLNLIPFRTIADYLFSNSAGVRRFSLGEVLGNVVVFVPLGACLPLLRRRTDVWSNVRIVIAVSVTVEVLQGLLGVGASDVDDVILNALGGLTGGLLLAGLWRLLRSWARVVTVMAVLAVLALPALVFMLFVVRLRM